MDLEEIQKSQKQYSKTLLSHYSRALGIEQEKVDLLYDILDSLKAIMEKNNVRQESLEWDQTGAILKDGKVILPDSFVKVLDEIVKDNQICSFFLPEDLGGMSFPSLFAGPIIESIAEYDFSLRMMALSGVGIMSLLTRYYTPAFDNALKGFADGKNLGFVSFSEAQAGSNLKNLKSTSELVGDEYVLNGTKLYITNGGYANTSLFLANNIVNGKVEGTNVFLIEGNDGITTERLEKKLGIQVSPTAQLLYENVTVPKENLVGELGQGYNKVLERLQGMRMAVAFHSVAASKRAYSIARTHAETREQFNRPIIAFEDVSRKLKNMEQQIPRFMDYAYLSAYALDFYNLKRETAIKSGNSDKLSQYIENSIPEGVNKGLTHYYVSSAKLYCGEIINPFMYDACQIFGGLGFISEAEVNKIARDVRILSIFDGTSEIHNWIINRSQKIINEMPNFQSPNSLYDEPTAYEKMMFARFPNLETML